ncbi:hypothetical protein DBR42_02820, partial [Pelomonas sp. HMWF004]
MWLGRVWSSKVCSALPATHLEEMLMFFTFRRFQGGMTPGRGAMCNFLPPAWSALSALGMVLSIGLANACALPGSIAGAVALGVMTVRVDATNTGQTIFKVHQQLPVDGNRAGQLRLLYPRWLPGWHGPYGDVSQIAGLTARVGGTRLAWR